MDYPQRGEIWLVSLEPVIGHEIGKTRPALVISNNRNNQFAETITVLPITSKTKKIYPFETFLLKDETNLPMDSKVKCNQIRTIDKRRMVRFLSMITEEKLKEVEQAVLIHLGIT
ncbi:type II toxin-antitoxin system PemK/MazF family toxin [Candidatus Aminicenantes bacterium AC-335-K20]|jgi:mRNA interferase MazF|nr:type II toxin-antitoxin system PemK/MazF family toxin [SCandidatus Aminicenantes bacterium Aminicenantia_JdfR_composite]MCP2596551.1 type II toxin-antitoxin system PemK/MazF family toxin [Candidatus Aminicenantes bacterium AC-335-G13]MCP2598317.1 type II toxin-antitoxin system PemK/MazF family toxin [Candidatus Aminicenantes bacterium AC-335-L06]MCP2605443.1 type II toxin-antitoxin system PemK/MazF family toxin [Candidatus Aminicenantes bacterium AC-335-O07]MCP2606110.1 type II toxin-antitox